MNFTEVRMMKPVFSEAKQKGIHSVEQGKERVPVGSLWSIEVPAGYSYCIDTEKTALDVEGNHYVLQIQKTDDCDFNESYPSKINVAVRDKFYACEKYSSNARDLLDEFTKMVQQLSSGGAKVIRAEKDILVAIYEWPEFFSYTLFILPGGTNTICTCQIHFLYALSEDTEIIARQFADSIQPMTVNDFAETKDLVCLDRSFFPDFEKAKYVDVDGAFKLPVPEGFEGKPSEEGNMKMIVAPEEFDVSEHFSHAKMALVLQAGTFNLVGSGLTPSEMINWVIKRIDEQYEQLGIKWFENGVFTVRCTNKGLIVNSYNSTNASERNVNPVLICTREMVYFGFTSMNYGNAIADNPDTEWDNKAITSAWLSHILFEGEKETRNKNSQKRKDKNSSKMTSDGASDSKQSINVNGTIYDHKSIDIFPKEVKLVLPDGYRLDKDFNDDGDPVYTIRGGLSYNDEGEEISEFTSGFMNVNVNIDDREKLVKEGKLKEKYVPGMMLDYAAETMLDSLREQFGEGKTLALHGSYPPASLLKICQPISIFGVTINTYIIMVMIEVSEDTIFAFQTVYTENEDGNQIFFDHLLNMIKAYRINGKQVDTGTMTGADLEQLLDMEIDENREALSMNLGINLKVGDEETQFTLNGDGSITENKVDTALEYAFPDESLYPHYNSMLRAQGFGMLGLNVIVNQSGTEYQFYQLFEDLDEDASEELKDAVSKLSDNGAKDYKLADKAAEMRKVFHVTPEVFDCRHDKESELSEGMMHRAYMMSGLRSFAWTLAKYCEELNTDPDNLSLDQIHKIIDFVSDRNWLNYDGESYCKSLCGTSDLHVYYVPDNTPKTVKAFFEPSKDELEELKTMKEKFPTYNPILSQVGSLDGLRKDLEFIYPAIEKIYEDVRANRDFSEPLASSDGDILYAWCALAYAARGPFFSEDGPTSCWFSQPLSEEERRIASEKERKELCDKWLKTNGKYLEKNPQIDFSGKKFVFTGLGYRQYSMEDETPYTQLVEDRGGLTRSKVSGVTDYLVIEPAGAGESKLNEALEQQGNGKPVKIILIDDLRKALGLDDFESEAETDDSDKPIPAALPAEETVQATEETVIVDDSWAILVPAGFKYSTDKKVIGSHRNIIIMEDKPDNHFDDPFSASISFTSMFGGEDNENMDGVSLAKMMVGFMGVKNNKVLKDDQDLYVTYYYEPDRSYKEAGEKLDVHHIKVGTVKGVSSIQVFFSDSPLSRREQTKLVEKVAKSIRLSKPGEKNTKATAPVKTQSTSRPTFAAPSNNPFGHQQNSMAMWGFQTAEVPEKRKKLIDNKYGYPIRFLPHSELQMNWEHDMAAFKYYCSVHFSEYFSIVAKLYKNAEKYATLFTDGVFAEDLKSGKLINSAPLHALRSFIWTATEMQGNKVKTSFPVDAPAEMWLDLAEFIGIHGCANYSPVDKKVKRFGAAFLRKEEVRSIYTDGFSFGNSQWLYRDEAVAKTMSNASISSLLQVVETLDQTMPIMDLYFEKLKDNNDLSSETCSTIKAILQGWSIFAFACKQPFFIVPGDYCKDNIEMSDAADWSASPELREINDGRFTLCENEIVKAKGLGTEVIIPEGITGMIISEDTKTALQNAFANTRKIVYPHSYTGPIAVPSNVREIEVLSDPEIILAKRISDDVPQLESLIFTGRPKSVGNQAFYGLEKLKTIELPEGVETLYERAFGGRIGGGKIVLPESISDVKENVFTEYNIDRTISLYVYKDCPALPEIKSQLRHHKNALDEMHRKYPNSVSFVDYNIKLIEKESPWLIKAQAFVTKIAWLYDKKNPSEIGDNTVEEILADTIGDSVNLSKCRDYIITESSLKGLKTLSETIKSIPDNQQLYLKLPEELTKDIRQSIDNKNREEKERKLNEIKMLSQSDSMSDLKKAITMLEEFKGEGSNAETLIQQCSAKLESIKEERYTQAISLAKACTIDSLNSALLKMEAISPYKDSSSRIAEWHKLLDNEKQYAKAVSSVDGEDIRSLITAKEIFEKLGDYKDSAIKSAACSRRADELKENLYQEALVAEKVYSLNSQNEAISKYSLLGDYKDSLERKNKCGENCNTIQAIHNLNKEIEEHRKELASLTGAFKKKERQAKETLIRSKEQHLNELKNKLTNQPQQVERSLSEPQKTEEEILAEIDVTEGSVNIVSPAAASASTPAIAIENSTVSTPSDSKTAAPSELKKKGKGGVIVAAVLIVAALAVVGWLAMSGRLGSIGQNEDTYVEEEVVQAITPEFTEANVLTIEELDREMYEDGDGIYVHYKVTNNSDSEIWYFGFSNRYYDKSGNILGENGGSYNGTLAPGKFAYVTDSPYFEKGNYDEIDTIEVTKYYYNIGNQSYDINLRTNELDSYSGAIEDQKNVDYETADIVSITLGDTLILKDGNYVLDVSATNNGKELLKSLSIYIEYYDEDGNSLAEESVGGLDMTLEPGEIVKTVGYCFSDYASQAKSFAIVEYEYELNKKDQNGYNHYTINKNVEYAYGMEW